jgi:hypothetical protein
MLPFAGETVNEVQGKISRGDRDSMDSISIPNSRAGKSEGKIRRPGQTQMTLMASALTHR